MNQPASLARVAADEGLPRYEEGPEWAAALANVLREVRNRGEADDGSRYYDHWLTALERLVTAKQLLSASDLDRRKAAWVQAYLSTPHGHPVELQAGLETPGGV